MSISERVARLRAMGFQVSTTPWNCPSSQRLRVKTRKEKQMKDSKVAKTPKKVKVAKEKADESALLREIIETTTLVGARLLLKRLKM